MKEFFRGVGDMLSAFRWWSRTPGTMALGLIPAAIAALILTAALVGVALGVAPAVTALTPFAEQWQPFWRDALRTAIVVAVLIGALFLATTLFVALTLAIGDPFYEKIWARVEEMDGGPVPDTEYGFWRGVGDGLSLFVRGIGVSLLAALAGLVPVVGVVLGPVVGALVGGRVLADELTSRALTHRGLSRAERRALTRPARARLQGFGAAAYALMLVPALSIVVMPTAVAGSTIAARRVLGLGASERR